MPKSWDPEDDRRRDARLEEIASLASWSAAFCVAAFCMFVMHNWRLADHTVDGVAVVIFIVAGLFFQNLTRRKY